MSYEPEPEIEELITPSITEFPIEDADKIYNLIIDRSKYSDESTCKQIKNLCNLDPKYCKEKKIKEEFHKLCMEIKKTSLMINDFFETETKNKDLKELYEIEDYINTVNIDKKLKLDTDVIDNFISIFKDKDFIKEEYDYDEYDMTWLDFENVITIDILKDMIYQFGIKLHSNNPDRYYPRIIERIKQKLLREYFM